MPTKIETDWTDPASIRSRIDRVASIPEMNAWIKKHRRDIAALGEKTSRGIYEYINVRIASILGEPTK